MLLVAPDSFKGSLSADKVAKSIALGASTVGIEALVRPVADGGEGTLDLLLSSFGGKRVRVRAPDPLGRLISAEFALLGEGSTAVIETAAASGLPLLAPGERDPLIATTRGTGELIVAARDLGARRIIVGAGGSATVDAGAGALAAIAEAGGLGTAALTVLCDSWTKFEDAAVVFGAQKGASPADLRVLTERLNRAAARFPRDPRGMRLSGGAGGLAGALWAVHEATLRLGASVLLDLIGFPRLLSIVDAVCTGEGRLDAQTLLGKVPGVVARSARKRGLATFAVVGQNRLHPRAHRDLGLTAVSEAKDCEQLVHAGALIGTELSRMFAQRACKP